MEANKELEKLGGDLQDRDRCLFETAGAGLDSPANPAPVLFLHLLGPDFPLTMITLCP